MSEMDCFKEFGVVMSEPPRIVDNLFRIPLGLLHNKLRLGDSDREHLVFFPYMATHYEGSGGSLLAASFVTESTLRGISSSRR